MENYKKFLQSRIRSMAQDYTTLRPKDRQDYIFWMIHLLKELDDQEDGEK